MRHNTLISWTIVLRLLLDTIALQQLGVEMKLINNHVLVKATDESSLLIHTLSGGIFVLDNCEREIIDRWVGSEIIECQNQHEEELFKHLHDNNFLTNNSDDEKQFEKRIMTASKSAHNDFCMSSARVAFVLKSAIFSK